jgi:hypothetical protein
MYTYDVCVRTHTCVCVYVCVRTYMWNYIYTYMHGRRLGATTGGKEGPCMCVCVRVYISL